MPENRIDSTSTGEGIQKSFSVASTSTDGPTDDKETTWINTQDDVTFEDALGYYKDVKTSEITAVVDAKSTWTVGRGFIADELTTMLLDKIKGNGFDTFNTILENAMRTMLLGGNFYAEIVRDDDGNLINIKPLNPAIIKHTANREGIITKFEQVDKNGKRIGDVIKPEKMFYLQRNRIADEIHGMGIAQKLKLIIDMKNEAMADQRIAMHRFVVPQWKFKLKTDEPTEIAAYQKKMDAVTGTGKNLYEPFDVSESELVSVPPNSTMNPIAWINYLDNLFYQMAGVPKIIVGGSSDFTEKASSIVYLAFQQSVEEEQLFIEEQVLSQLNLVIELEFPVSLENELLSDEKKDQDPTTVQPNETTAGAGQ